MKPAKRAVDVCQQAFAHSVTVDEEGVTYDHRGDPLVDAVEAAILLVRACADPDAEAGWATACLAGLRDALGRAGVPESEMG